MKRGQYRAEEIQDYHMDFAEFEQFVNEQRSD